MERHPGFSSREKRDAVLRVLAGDSEASVAGELGVPEDRLQRWRTTFTEAGYAALSRRHDDRHRSWLVKHRGPILQWGGMLIVLFLTVLLFTRMLIPE